MTNIFEDIEEEFSIGNMAPVVPLTGGEEGVLSKYNKPIEKLIETDNAEILNLPKDTKFEEEEPEDEKFDEYSFDDIDSYADVTESVSYFIGYFGTIGAISTIALGIKAVEYTKIKKAIKLYEDNNNVPYKISDIKYKTFSMDPFKKSANEGTELGKIKAILQKTTGNTICTVAVTKTEPEKQIFRFYTSNSDNSIAANVEFIDSKAKGFEDYYHAAIVLKIRRELGNIATWADDIIDKYGTKTKTEKVAKNINEAFKALDLFSTKDVVEESTIDKADILSEEIHKKIIVCESRKESLYKALSQSDNSSFNRLLTEYTSITSEELSLFEEAIKGKQKYNDEGKKVPDTCPECGSKVGVVIKGEPVYCCTNKECKKCFGTLPFKESTTDIYEFESEDDIDWDADETVLVEAKDIADDMLEIIRTLNGKGYKTKYSSPGFPSARMKKDMYRDGIYKGKLYSTARIVFANIYDFKDIPKHWVSRILDGDKTAIYVKNPSYKITDGLPTNAFYKWKEKYMGTLNSWVNSLPQKGEDQKDDIVKIEESANNSLNEIMDELFVEIL